MANDPKKAREKRAASPPRQNAQSLHEGGAHKPEEFPGTAAGAAAKAPGVPPKVEKT